MGKALSQGNPEWVTDLGSQICMAYPGDQQWGAVFITLGKPGDRPHPGINLSGYATLSLELRGGVGGESVQIGLKDNTDPDNGQENKITVSDLTTGWQTYTFPLSEFVTADLTRLYVVTEFVFGTQPGTVCFRSVQYLPSTPYAARLDLWHIQGLGRGPQIIVDSVGRFKVDHPGANVETVFWPNDTYKTRIAGQVSAGKAPCIFPTWGGGILHEYVKAGRVLDLTEMMKRGDYQARFVAGSLDNVTFDGRLWGVPVENTAAGVVFYNKAIFATYGLMPPKTYEDLLVVIDKLSRAGVTPFALANKTSWPGLLHYMYLVDRLGGPGVFKAAANRTGGSFEDPAFIRAGEMLQDLVRRGAFNKAFNDLEYDSAQSRLLLYRGEAAMELMGTWNIPIVKAENPAYFERNLDFFPYPAIEGGRGDPADVIGTIGDQYYHISAACEHPDLAFQLMQYLIDDQAVAQRTLYGAIPPVKTSVTDDPALRKVIDIVQKAPSVQLWYDQYLPHDLAEVCKNTIQELLSLAVSPAAAAKTMEEAARKFYGEK